MKPKPRLNAVQWLRRGGVAQRGAVEEVSRGVLLEGDTEMVVWRWQEEVWRERTCACCRMARWVVEGEGRRTKEGRGR